MKTSLSTGGDRDFLMLIAETTSECCELVQAAQSSFVRDAKRMFLDYSQTVCGMKTVALHVYLSDMHAITPEEQARINQAHDEVA